MDRDKLFYSEATGLYKSLSGTEIKSGSRVAICWHHYKWLTVKQMKKRGCLGRQCGGLEKRTEHPYWEKRAKTKQLRKERKERLSKGYKE